MNFENIDLILDSSFTEVSSSLITITQYSTNIKLRVAFKERDFNPSRLIAIVNNGLSLPAKPIFLSKDTILVDGEERFFYEYNFTQYDTEKFVETITLTVNGYDDNGSMIGSAVLEIPMERADFAKLSPSRLEDDNSLIQVIEKANNIQNQFNEFVSIGGTEADAKINKHNLDSESHPDIRENIRSLDSEITDIKSEITDASKLSTGTIKETVLPGNIAYSDKNNNFVAPQTINGTLTVNGDIIQKGQSFTTESEIVKSKDDYIILRDGATAGLGANESSGLQFNLYDGVNTGRLAVDANGVVRVGDLGREQPLATREENPKSGGFARWDSTTSRFYTDTDVASLSQLENKVDRETGKGLSTNDFSTVAKNKLDSIEYGAEKNVRIDWNSQSGINSILNKPSSLPNPSKLILTVNNEVIGEYDGSTEAKIAISQSALEQVQSDWNEGDSTSKAYIKNKPTIPSKTSDLTNDSGFISTIPETYVTEDELSDALVAKIDRSEIDLSSIVTTDTQALEFYLLATETGSTVETVIDPNSYVLTVRLRNKDGIEISHSSVDLPLESVVVGGRYEEGKLYLTLKNGSEIAVEVEDIVTGLVPTSRKINGKELSSDIVLEASDLNTMTRFEIEDFVKSEGGKIDSISVNGKGQIIVDKNVDIKVPTKLSEFENDIVPKLPDWIGDEKPTYRYNEIINAPTKLSEFENDLKFLEKDDANFVSYLEKQSLSEDQKQIARDNIGASERTQILIFDKEEV